MIYIYNNVSQHCIDFIDMNKEDKFGYLLKVIENSWQILRQCLAFQNRNIVFIHLILMHI